MGESVGKITAVLSVVWYERCNPKCKIYKPSSSGGLWQTIKRIGLCKGEE